MRARIDFAALERPRILGEPAAVVACDEAADVPAALAEVERRARGGMTAVGYVAYDAAPAFDSALRVREGCALPLVWFGLYDDAGTPPAAEAGGHLVSEWTAAVPDDEYTRSVCGIREMIEAGGVYQVNYAFPLEARFSGDPYGYYRVLQAAQRPAFGAYLDVGERQILSLSPELFFHRRGQAITMRPMKGTADRGLWPADDEARIERLRSSEKDRAENLMIVDLVRNDLGRIARTGSVRAPRLFEVERLPTVLQMTSTVEADLAHGVALPDIFGALFPCGSVTGAPKVAAMAAIARLERAARGVYCGAIGLVLPGGDAVFSVAIRTVVIAREAQSATYWVGSGITWDSCAHAEHAECLSKARGLTDRPAEFELVETLRLADGEYYLLDRHLDRLAASAAFFGFCVNRHRTLSELSDVARRRADGRWRVRLTADRGGDVRTTVTALTSDGTDGPVSVRMAAEPVNRLDPLLYHKTTASRKALDARRLGHEDVYDVLLLNEDGELTEFTRGNVALQLDGLLFTPPVSSGLLAGTLRAELLAEGVLTERRLTGHDLRACEALYFLNSVRGMLPARLVP